MDIAQPPLTVRPLLIVIGKIVPIWSYDWKTKHPQLEFEFNAAYNNLHFVFNCCRSSSRESNNNLLGFVKRINAIPKFLDFHDREILWGGLQDMLYKLGERLDHELEYNIFNVKDAHMKQEYDEFEM